jgi:acetyltransferase-like isoleucine patch superfamily enzyme
MDHYRHFDCQDIPGSGAKMKEIIFRLLFVLYKRCNYRYKKVIQNIYKRLDGGEMASVWLRRLFKEYHNILIGTGSYGGCFKTENINENTVIGKYCSIANSVYIYNRDHPCGYVSTHPMFFNVKYGPVPMKNQIEYKKKLIGNDVWIGQNAIILASVTQIGDGAVIGAGAVVTKDVPEYAIVAGVPAKIIGYRFEKEQADLIKKSEWWDWDPEKIRSHIGYFSDLNGFIEFVNKEEGIIG